MDATSVIEKYKNYIKNKKAAVIGIGVSNTPLIKFLVKCGADVTALDKQSEEKLKDRLEQLKHLPVKFKLGNDYLENLSQYDVVFKTPGIRYDIPELLDAVKNNVVVTSEMEVFFELCPAQIIAVTGSDGKTTTTTIIYEILKQHGYKCWLGGNIGQPLIDVVEYIDKNDKVVLELSSFQLHTMKKSADIAVITNVSPNHLDIHKSMDEYINAKQNIFTHQNSGGKLIVNYNNDITRRFGEIAKGEAVYFDKNGIIKQGAILSNGELRYVDELRDIEIVKQRDIVIPGMHNVENYLAAIAAVIDMVQPEDIKKVAISFKGVEHRIEYVKTVNGVKFYNDSIGSSPTRTKATLESFKQKVILICGGYDKNISYDEIGKVIDEKVKKLVLIGQTAPKIKKSYELEMKKQNRNIWIPIVECNSLNDAVHEAYKDTQRGDIVVLSPASASFDMFRNFEERGNAFKEIVRNL